MGADQTEDRFGIPAGSDPPCMQVCPSTATRVRDDGIVIIDHDLCIGCAYCFLACPCQAHYKVERHSYAYGRQRNLHEATHDESERIGVAQKCTFCSDRIDYGQENGLTPGLDPEASPSCVNSCIAGALHFGNLEDPDSNISKLLREHEHFRMHEQLKTEPGFFYLWEERP